MRKTEVPKFITIWAEQHRQLLGVDIVLEQQHQRIMTNVLVEDEESRVLLQSFQTTGTPRLANYQAFRMLYSKVLKIPQYAMQY